MYNIEILIWVLLKAYGANYAFPLSEEMNFLSTSSFRGDGLSQHFLFQRRWTFSALPLSEEINFLSTSSFEEMNLLHTSSFECFGVNS